MCFSFLFNLCFPDNLIKKIKLSAFLKLVALCVQLHLQPWQNLMNSYKRTEVLHMDLREPGRKRRHDGEEGRKVWSLQRVLDCAEHCWGRSNTKPECLWLVGVRLDDDIEELLPQSVGSTSYYFDVLYIYITLKPVFHASTVAIYQNNMKVILLSCCKDKFESDISLYAVAYSLENIFPRLEIRIFCNMRN